MDEKFDGVNISLVTFVSVFVKYFIFLRNGNIYWEEKRERWGDEICIKDLGFKYYFIMMKIMI